jgi:hypothetical protein
MPKKAISKHERLRYLTQPRLTLRTDGSPHIFDVHISWLPIRGDMFESERLARELFDRSASGRQAENLSWLHPEAQIVPSYDASITVSPPDLEAHLMSEAEPAVMDARAETYTPVDDERVIVEGQVRVRRAGGGFDYRPTVWRSFSEMACSIAAGRFEASAMLRLAWRGRPKRSVVGSELCDCPTRCCLAPVHCPLVRAGVLRDQAGRLPRARLHRGRPARPQSPRLEHDRVAARVGGSPAGTLARRRTRGVAKRRPPNFPDVCARVLNRDASIPITFVAFDVLRMDGKNMMDASFEERRAALVRLPLRRQRPSSRRRSLTARPSSTPCASSGSKAWSRSAYRAVIAGTSAPGSRRRTRTTGVATSSVRRCSARGSAEHT